MESGISVFLFLLDYEIMRFEVFIILVILFFQN